MNINKKLWYLKNNTACQGIAGNRGKIAGNAGKTRERTKHAPGLSFNYRSDVKYQTRQTQPSHPIRLQHNSVTLSFRIDMKVGMTALFHS